MNYLQCPTATHRHWAAWALIPLLTAALLLSSCSKPRQWLEFRGNQGLGRAEGAVHAPVALKWDLELNKPPADQRLFNQPLIVDGTMYFGSADGNFYSFDIEGGHMNWMYRSGGPINSVPAADEHMVYFGSTDGAVYALERGSGELAWRFQTGGQVNSTIILYEDTVVAAADVDAVYFIRTDGSLERTIANQGWRRNSFQIFNGVMAFAPGTPEDPHSLSVYDIPQERYSWSLTEDLSQYYWFSFPAVRRGKLFFSTTGLVVPGVWQHYFSGIDMETGLALWSRRETAYFDTPINLDQAVAYLQNYSQLLDYAAPLVWKNQVIFAMGDQLLRSFRASDGELQWTRSYPAAISSAVTLAGDRLYFGLEADNGSGRLVCASASDGSSLWEIEIEGSMLNSPVIAGPWIVFGTDEGHFYVFEQVF